MEIVRRVHAMKETIARSRSRGLRVGLVPTMGFLHDGHLMLMRRARELCDVLVVSIFVNPTQFGPDEDFERYPRDLTGDADKCISEGVDYLFAPGSQDLYPSGACTFVEVDELSARLEGRTRPGHFRGVTTVVMKLFQIVRPNVAAFGQKDAQQAVVIRRMVRDLMLDVEILVLPTLRDEEGLALSSRNAYLDAGERAAALAIPRALAAAQAALAAGARKPAEVVDAAREVLEAEPGLQIDYVELVGAADLVPLSSLGEPALLVLAAWAGKTRLIDNASLPAG